MERLLTFVVSTAEARATVAADRVDFIDEDDTRRVLLSLLEQVTNAAGSYSDEHFDEVRAGNREERNVGFARDCACQQRLAGAWRPDKQHTLGNAAAKLLEF